jgi:stage V sporulation protein AE
MIGQILIQRTTLTPARIVVFFVSTGAILSGLGLYQPLVDYAGAGATVPITGFGHILAKGVMKDVDTLGFLGIFTGGIKATAAGVCAAVFFSLIAALLTRSHAKT